MLLKIGSNGDDVKKLQEKLGLNADGAFGPGTAKAVKEWQTSHGLTADGIVGNGTWAKMFDGDNETPATEPVEIGESNLNLEALRGHIPDAVLAQIPDTAAKFNITTNLRLAHFLSQCGHESGNFTAVKENLNYSGDGLLRIFPRYFNTGTNASYARQPEKIANRVYADRMGNGNEASGDGYKFRGRGYIQLTGKQNYTAFGRAIGEDILSNPDLVATKYPLASAAFFFNNNNLWTICDKGADEATVTSVTRRVNGGTIGLAQRLAEFKTFYNLLS
jgi:putative chitinase